jgi:hypothetical protein
MTIRRIVTVVIGIVLAMTVVPHAHAAEGCTIAGGTRFPSSPIGPSCSYRAKKAGGIVASGNMWRVKIVRGRRVIQYGPANYTDAARYTLRKPNAIRKGDRVYVSTGDTVYDPWSCICVVFDFVGTGPDYNS